jgi:vitamin B12 transporter
MFRSPLFLLTLLLAHAGHAQSDSLSGGTLDTLRVTATRITSPLQSTGRHLQVVDSATLATAPRPEVSELLRTHTLVDVRQRGPFDVQTNLSIRGGTFEQALLLVDGIPMTDPQTGHHLMNIPLLADALERVEVLHGGASRTFGGGAFSGAIHLITREARSNRGSLTLEGGEYGTYRARLSQETGNANGGIRLTAFHARSGGYIHNTDFDQSGAHLSGHRRFGTIKLQAQLGAVHKRFGAQNFYSSAFPDQHEITGTYLGALTVRNDQGPWRWLLRSYHRRHDDQFQLFRESDGFYRHADGYFIRGTSDTARFSPTFFYTFHNRHRTRVSGAEASLARSWQAGTTAIGIHGRDERILSNVLGEPLGTPREAAGAREAFTRGTGRRNLAIHMDHRYERGRSGIDAGVLVNLNTEFIPEWIPGADIFHRWNGHHTTYASAGRAFRLPTWTDLYYNRGGAQGSRDLRPEHADQLELGHRVAHRRWSATLALWRRQGRDLIDWVRLPGETLTRAANLTRVDINGVEIAFTHTLPGERGRGGLLYAYQWADQQGFNFTSLYVLDHLEHNAVLWWQQRIGRAWHLHTSANWRTRSGTYARFADGAAMPYPAPLRLDMRLQWQKGAFTLFVGGTNLLDAEQIDRGNILLPGRWMTGGAQVQWGQR